MAAFCTAPPFISSILRTVSSSSNPLHMFVFTLHRSRYHPVLNTIYFLLPWTLNPYYPSDLYTSLHLFPPLSPKHLVRRRPGVGVSFDSSSPFLSPLPNSTRLDVASSLASPRCFSSGLANLRADPVSCEGRPHRMSRVLEQNRLRLAPPLRTFSLQGNVTPTMTERPTSIAPNRFLFPTSPSCHQPRPPTRVKRTLPLPHFFYIYFFCLFYFLNRTLRRSHSSSLGSLYLFLSPSSLVVSFVGIIRVHTFVGH
jgi:hypothetical protein